MVKKIASLLFLVGSAFLPAMPQHQMVIPCPLVTNETGMLLQLDADVVSYAMPALVDEAAFLQQELQKRGKKAALKKSKKGKRGILLRVDTTLQGKEAYRMEADARQIVLTGGGEAGVFYAIQTLLQQLDGNALRTGITEDAPRYGWRGIMLDESRHFFGKAKVKQILDIMAYYKLNKLHWHLTDEPGWRIEIKRYPLLTTVGSQGCWSDLEAKEVKFYTQEDIAEIVAYAAARHIEIIPEIDMPGHATAANRAYPELSGGGTKDHPDFTFNVGRENVYAFLTHVLREVAALFPSPYLHLGGDEVSFGIEAWKTDPDVQALIKREGLADVKAAERYFMNRMSDSVRALGKVLVGWDELLDLHPAQENTLIMWWRHDRVGGLKRSLAEGYQTVMCPRRPLYFDFIQYKDHKWGRVWNGFCPLEDVYAFPDQGMASWKLPQEDLKCIRGLQANVWTERIHTEQRLDFMLFPRICAVAESGWTQPDRKNYTDFTRRMEQAYQLFDRLGIYYFDARNPSRHPEPAGPKQKQREVPMDFRD